MSETSLTDMREPQRVQKVTEDSQCRRILLLLAKPDATDSPLSCSAKSYGCKPFLSEWEWAIPGVMWVFAASAATYRGCRTRYWHSVPRHEGRKLKGIVRSDTSASQGV